MGFAGVLALVTHGHIAGMAVAGIPDGDGLGSDLSGVGDRGHGAFAQCAGGGDPALGRGFAGSQAEAQDAEEKNGELRFHSGQSVCRTSAATRLSGSPMQLRLTLETLMRDTSCLGSSTTIWRLVPPAV